ncbi:hypothetical protein A2335_04185 [Candidatus Peregrinibacteria bacterium RIFOXYB2_FULL_32_7]|nr:MAG: hypothetical protein A2335_04185 [Candidatus Peregrinibacteria bacterium RIFOXYB2_FULL_32_7]
MSLLQSLLLGLLQGITEFLPISSSGHLVLGEYFLNLEFESLKSFDVVLHVGSLLAILIYFYKDFSNIIKNIFNIKGQSAVFKLFIATIPAVIIGLTLEEQIDSIFRNPKMIAIVMIFTGLIFFLSEKFPKDKDKTKISLKNMFLIGIAQAIAIIPGISRSGSTIAMGLFQGIKREQAAKISFMLGSIAIFGAGLLTSLKIEHNESETLSIEILLAGFISSLLASLLSISWLMKFLKNHKLNVFGGYLIMIGAITLIFI